MFEKFSDAELYVLSRALIESSCIFTIGDGIAVTRYSKVEQQIHNDLLNAVLKERKRRDYN